MRENNLCNKKIKDLLFWKIIAQIWYKYKNENKILEFVFVLTKLHSRDNKIIRKNPNTNH